MKFVLTNDDGVHAPGIRALAEACRELGELAIIAPDKPRSGIGHRVTTERPLRLLELDHEESLGFAPWACDGTPADCARVALRHLEIECDWVVVGVNEGGNLGADVHGSGTVAAAREAALLGKPAIAISQYIAPRVKVDWDLTARLARQVIAALIERDLPPGCFWNANLPSPLDEAHLAGSNTLPLVDCTVDPSPMDVRYRVEDGLLAFDGSYFGRPRAAAHDIDVCFSGSIAVSRIAVHHGC